MSRYERVVCVVLIAWAALAVAQTVWTKMLTKSAVMRPIRGTQWP